MSHTFLSNLQWRFATKNFDPKKHVYHEELKQILEAIRLTPTAYGLQAYHVVVVSDKELKQKLAEVSQPQVGLASYVLIFCVQTDYEKRVRQFMDLSAQIRQCGREGVRKREQTLIERIEKKSETKRLEWLKKQVYIALGFALAACTELKIDSCPMEGFQARKVNELLKLPQGVETVLMLPIGYRDAEPRWPKIRFSAEELFTLIR